MTSKSVYICVWERGTCVQMIEQNMYEVSAERVAERLIEAFAVDARLPRVARPRAPGSHSTVKHSADDMAQWEVEKFDADKALSRIHPQPDEIAAMERAFDWLPPVARADADAYEALRHWCRRMAEPVASHGKRSLRSIAAALGIPPMKLLRRKDKALGIIVANLATAGATA
jgi:hypothetical protein